MSEPLLPPGFEDLAPWCDWARANMTERSDRRINSSMEEIEAFYDAMLPRLDAVLEHLAATPLDTMDAQSEMLMNLSLAMAEIAPAVEQFFEPTVSYGYDVTRYKQGPE